MIALAVTVGVTSAKSASGGVIYGTGFEAPTFTEGNLAGQDSWNVFAFSGSIDTGAVVVQSERVKSGTQAVRIDAAIVGSQQAGPRRNSFFDASSGGLNTVVMEADVFLSSASVSTAWQFGGLTQDGQLFIGGFNVNTDGTLQFISSGFPMTSTAAVARDVWNRYEVHYRFDAQRFDVFINSSLVASDIPFLTNQTSFGAGIIATFGTGNDRAYIDNYAIRAVPEPGSMTLATLGVGTIGLAGWVRRSRSSRNGVVRLNQGETKSPVCSPGFK